MPRLTSSLPKYRLHKASGRVVANIKSIVMPLLRLRGRTPAVEFGPLNLKAVRNEMISSGWTRTHVNSGAARWHRPFWRIESAVERRQI